MTPRIEAGIHPNIKPIHQLFDTTPYAQTLKNVIAPALRPNQTAMPLSVLEAMTPPAFSCDQQQRGESSLLLRVAAPIAACRVLRVPTFIIDAHRQRCPTSIQISACRSDLIP
jgi:hypothetical protein